LIFIIKMATTRPFAYNTGSTISETEQVGDIAVGIGQVRYDEDWGGVKWWNGPDEDLGYVIAQPVPSGDQPNPLGISAYIGFFRSTSLTEVSFVELTNQLFNQSFTTGNECKVYLNNNGYWTSWITVVTPTPTNTPTITPTPSITPEPVTGFGYNLVVLPYQPPTSGNTIFPTFANPSLNSGTTNPNTFTINGVYWNPIDNSGVDRTSYYSGMTGVSVTAYFTQNGETAIYSGSSTAFTLETGGGISFAYNPGSRPGQLILIQSASTNFVTGQTVYISYEVNTPVTPTPTPTNTPTVTPTITPTITPTPTPTMSPTLVISAFTAVGSTTWTAPAGVTSVEYLVVGGGGGAGNGYDNAGGGGGGAGMVLSGSTIVTPGNTYTVTVGAGGVGGANERANNAGLPGNNSVFDSITALGGGNGLGSRTGGVAGVAQVSNTTSATGGSGSGGGFGGKGGGGSTGNGSNNSGSTGGAGGSGTSSSITGSVVIYGVGGSGANAGTQNPGVNGTSNTGNGGRAGGAGTANSTGGGNGGSGVVVIKYYA
jgi:hypothetical protein